MKKMMFTVALAILSMGATAQNLPQSANDRINMGYEPIKPFLKQVRRANNRAELLRLMYELDNKGFHTALFGITPIPHPRKSSEVMMGVTHSGATLPQEYYAQPDEQQQVVDAIKNKNRDLLKLVGHSDLEAERLMQMEWAVEHEIGVKALNQQERQNPQARIHFMSWKELQDTFMGIDWDGYRDAMSLPQSIDTVNVAELEPMHAVEDILANASINVLKAYMELRIIKTYFGNCSDAPTDSPA